MVTQINKVVKKAYITLDIIEQGTEYDLGCHNAAVQDTAETALRKLCTLLVAMLWLD